MAATAPKDQARDLEADLALYEATLKIGCPHCVDGPDTHDGCSVCDKVSVWTFNAEARTGWPYAINRAMEAENEVDKLRRELETLQDEMNGRRHPWD